ncbi:hypothetical protein [Burkholderia gladioli]|uniref:hypothetical protein n=1 Tax=Burkholderia gladioli TaxID=28095 RepID=UPI00163E9BCF|nr:hypothetical protein [Burkholderia gladioli]
MKRLTAFIMRALRAFRCSPVLSGALIGLLIAPASVLGGWSVVWLIHWLPWPGGAK